MKAFKNVAENTGKTRTESQKLVFYWIFNPDGSIIDYSNGNYLSLLENNYKPVTSRKSYLGA